MRNALRVAGVGVLAAFAALGSLSGASAHETRVVGDGQFEVVVGFVDEPAFQGEKNGLSLEVSRVEATDASPAAEAEDGHSGGAGVEGLELTLQAEVIYGDQRMTLTLEPVWQSPGAYAGYFFPMAAGDYSFHIFGTVEGVQIDETFTSGPETFSAIQERAPLEVPKQSASSAPALGLTAGIGIAGLAIGAVVARRRFVA